MEGEKLKTTMMSDLTKSSIESPKGPTQEKEATRITTLSTSKKVFLTGLSGYTKESDLLGYLKNISKGVTGVGFPQKRNAGYAFVELESVCSMEEILKLKNLIFNGRKIQIKPFRQGEDLKKFKDEVNLRRLFVANIPKSFRNEQIKEIFSRFGELEAAYIIRDRDSGISRGFGYIVFSSEELANKVAKSRVVRSNNIELYVKIHQPKNKKNGGKLMKNPRKERTRISKEEKIIPIQINPHWLKPTSKNYRRLPFQVEYRKEMDYRLNIDYSPKAIIMNNFREITW